MTDLRTDNYSLDPIDAVYTWVDDKDPAWQQRKNEAALRFGLTASAPAVDPSRFADHEELRFSLRSLQRFLPWIRTIHIVTDAQVPSWLDTTPPRVRIVDHRQIFPDQSALPTFNSLAIETCLRRIPGLAERFIYLNDDMLFGRPLRPMDFFAADGRPRAFVFRKAGHVLVNALACLAPSLVMRLQSAHLRWWLRTIGPKKKPFSRALRHTRLVMLDRLKRPLHLVKTHHTPLALTLDQLHAIETTYGDDYARCMRHTFRAADDIYHPDLLAIHGLMTDLVVPTWMRRSHLLYFHLGVDPFETLTRVSQNRHWFVNIDDKVGSSPQVVARLRAALDAVYPGPATFEIAACRSGRQKSHATAPTTPKVEPPWDQDEPPQ